MLFKIKVTRTNIIFNSAKNMNSILLKKYVISSNDIEEKSLSSKKFRTLLNFHRIRQTKKIYNRLDKCSQNKYEAKKKNLHADLEIGEKVLVLAERIRKKSVPGKFYKQTVQNSSYFNKKETFVVRKNKNI